MMYTVSQIRDNGDEFISLYTKNKEEAISQARGEWELLCDYDRKHNAIEVRAYANDITDDECDCFDYDTVEWAFANEPQDEDKVFPTCTIIELSEAFNPALISIENDDYRGCDPAPIDRLKLWYRGTHILSEEVSKIVIDGDIWRVWL